MQCERSLRGSAVKINGGGEVLRLFPPPGMVLSVFVVLLLTVFFEILKVWRVWLSSSSKLAWPPSAYGAPSGRAESCSVLEASPSESSLTPTETQPQSARNRWEPVVGAGQL